MKYKILGITLIITALGIIIFITYHNSQKRQQPLVFSPPLMLSSLWHGYKSDYWDSGTGRTLDKQRDNITTSEGQSYTMLRAVWQDDQPAFEKTWQWTKENLKRPSDHLSSWLYGRQPDGSYAVAVSQGGQNSATDAETDMAVALLFAASRWNNANYLADAKNIINDIWDKEVVTVNGVPYIAADDIEKDNPQNLLINPSYLAPYAYRMFDQVDPSHNWNGVIDSSYKVLELSSASPLDKPSSAGLPPDWVVMDKETGQLKAPDSANLTTNYGYDAMRVPFRLALDWEWYKEPRAKQLLDKFNFLAKAWNGQKALDAVYSHDGQVISNIEAPAMYGAGMGYFLAAQPASASEVYNSKLEALYSPDIQYWKKPLSYYDDNWAWFGIAMYNGYLPNLFATVDKAASFREQIIITPQGLVNSFH
ncbi:MAG: glycosyl hydrolase family 8 [Patescibacteria group bacterium]|nr:glycosyl hydrolase family 8 [Patescibacteria group bacterium]